MKAKICFGLFLSALIFLSGCTMAITGKANVDKNSFSKEKKYALVSIAASKEFKGEQGFFQMFQKNENIQGINTQPVLDQLVPVIRAKLSKTGHFTSVPMKSIINSKPYLGLEEDEKIQKIAFLSNEINVANEYKYFSDPGKLSKLASDLKVDGVISLMMNFNVETMKSNFYVGPLSLGKKEYAASVGISAIAYDKQGKIIWKDSTMKQAEPGDKKSIVLIDTSDFSGVNFEKLHPSAVRIGGYAVDVLIQRFQDTMEGKGTSIFQNIKDKGSKEATRTES